MEQTTSLLVTPVEVVGRGEDVGGVVLSEKGRVRCVEEGGELSSVVRRGE